LNYGDDAKGKSKKDEGRSPEVRDQRSDFRMLDKKTQKSDFGFRIGQSRFETRTLSRARARGFVYVVRFPAAPFPRGILIIAHQYRVPLLSAKAKAREGPANPPISVLFSATKPGSALRIALPSLVSTSTYAAFEIQNLCRHTENHLGAFLSILDDRGDFRAVQ